MTLTHLRRAALFNAVEQWIAGKPSPVTQGNYRKALGRFAGWAADGDVESAVDRLCSLSKAETEQVLRAWTKDQSPTYGGHNRASISSLIGHLNKVGLCPYVVDGLQVGLVDDRQMGLRSATPLGIAMQLLSYAKKEAAGGDEQAVRDYAILRLALIEGMRRTTIGRMSQSAPLGRFNEETRRAINAWQSLRGPEPGWMFVRTDREDATRPLSGESIRRLMIRMCGAVGLPSAQPDVLRKHAQAAKAIEMEHDRFAGMAELADVAMQIGFMTPGRAIDEALAAQWNEVLAKLMGGAS